MPPVKASHWRAVIIVVWIMYKLIMRRIIWVSQKWRIIGLLYCLAIFLMCKTPGTTKIVLCSGTTYGRVFLITINIKLYFAFSPPVSFQSCQGKICTNIMSFTFYIVQNYIILCYFCHSLASPLRMEIGCILWQLIIQAVVYLIKECRYWVIMLVFQCNSRFSAKWHLEVTVKTSIRYY